MKPNRILTNDAHQVEIYDNCWDTLRVYKTFATLTIAGTKWVGNSGGYHEYKHRIEGDDFAALQNLLTLRDADEDLVKAEEIVDAAVVAVQDDDYYPDSNTLISLSRKIKALVTA